MQIEGENKLELLIEIPRWSFSKRTSSGKLDFVSPFPCPFNYGRATALAGADGDPLDIVMLGPRLPRGTKVKVPIVGAVQFIDRGIADDKLICGTRPIGHVKRFWILAFFRFYAQCKKLLYLFRRLSGPTYCAGWCNPAAAIARARQRQFDPARD